MMNNIFWRAVCQIYKRKIFSLMTVLMMTVAIAVMFYSFVLYSFFHYPLRQARHILNDDVRDVYKLEYRTILAAVPEDELSELCMFYNEMGGLEGIDKCGMYAMSYNYTEDMQELYIQRDIIDLCNLQTINGTTVELEETEQYGAAYVGFELATRYPKGSIYVTTEGEQYLILDVLDKDTKWLFDELGASVIDLDCAVLLDYDYVIDRDLNHIKNGMNNYYFVTKDADMSDIVMQLAEGHNLGIYGIFNLESSCFSYIKSDVLARGESYYFPLLSYLASVSAIMMASMTAFLSNKADYGIMLVNGMTKRQVMMVIVLENLFKLLVSCMMATLYWFLNLNRLDSTFYMVLSDSIVLTTLQCIVTVILISIIPVILIKRYRINDMLAEK
ncbi:MAG: hypothetical protein K2G45_11045 [Lachnospiraceae bacterium]|nr:hypothetical protein [Lachnospiraceae bacterium]